MPTGYTVDDDKKQRIVEAHIKHKVPVSELAKGYGVNRKTIYKWLAEAKEKETQVSTDKATDDKPSTEAPETTPEPTQGDEPTQEPTAPQEDAQKVLDDAKAEAQRIVEDAKTEAAQIKADAAADANETRAKAQEDAEAIRQEVKEAADKVASSEPADVPQEETDCPNPSCDAKFTGNECPNCDYKHDASVYPFAQKPKA